MLPSDNGKPREREFFGPDEMEFRQSAIRRLNHKYPGQQC
jgi:hypothetical protein